MRIFEKLSCGLADRTGERNDLAGAEERSKPAFVHPDALAKGSEGGNAQVAKANEKMSCGAATDS